ncbi:hypothetical protein NLJ89_g5307 [Agrocybe chaxingu]|uniref:Uncharacterized protein n=1 Tax=Agrocybe chaxingu TaxID=84603 RepID=A0A9W8MXC3_9AGAR|nr:hypothetical protein NLJ89_g5307 [Agrocybe chaxingu]
MKFLSILSSLALLGATATAAPTSSAELATRGVAESIVNATALGVDVYGQIPGDAVRKAPGYFTAEPGTHTWAWIRAQMDIDWNAIPVDKRDELEKNQTFANIGIGMFAQDWCNGVAVFFDNVRYNVQHFTATNMFSVVISHRGLRNNEQLDFSRRSGNDFCGMYLYTAAQNTPVGCFNSQLINCFRLWLR